MYKKVKKSAKSSKENSYQAKKHDELMARASECFDQAEDLFIGLSEKLFEVEPTIDGLITIMVALTHVNVFFKDLVSNLGHNPDAEFELLESFWKKKLNYNIH